MARVDDYQQSFDLAAAELKTRDFLEVARLAGAQAAPDGASFSLSYYGRRVSVAAGDFAVSVDDGGPEVPLAEQALIMHYLVNADGSLPSEDWITFREVESGEFYWSAFVKRAKKPLLDFFGMKPELLDELAPLVGGDRPGSTGDKSVVVQAFPNVPIMLVLWAGDEEFPPDGNVLFDRSVGKYFNTEDIALAAGLPIYKMMGIFYSRGK